MPSNNYDTEESKHERNRREERKLELMLDAALLAWIENQTPLTTKHLFRVGCDYLEIIPTNPE